MAGKIADRMPYFKKLSLGDIEVITVPRNGIHRHQANRENYRNKDEYSISANYYNHCSIKFEIQIINKSKSKLDLNIYTFFWQFMHDDKKLSSNFVTLSDKIKNLPQYVKRTKYLRSYEIKVPSITTTGEHELLLKIFKNQEGVSVWEQVAHFDIFSADKETRDRGIENRGVFKGALGTLIAELALAIIIAVAANWATVIKAIQTLLTHRLS